METLSREQLRYIIQFQHPDKTLAVLPGANEANVAALFGLEPDAFAAVRREFDAAAAQAAAELLQDAAFARQVEKLPFRAGQVVVGLGDSITDDLQSWLVILRHVLSQHRGQDKLEVVNAGVSGDTSTQMISRFLAIALLEPAWIVCMAGTNDTRLHGLSPTKTLVSLDETKQNLHMLRRFAAEQTEARWVWMTPARVIEPAISAHWFLGPMQLRWRNDDLAAVARHMMGLDDPVVNLQEAFGDPVDPALLLSDGLHPSLQGQKRIVRTLVATLAQPH